MGLSKYIKRVTAWILTATMVISIMPITSIKADSVGPTVTAVNDEINTEDWLTEYPSGVLAFEQSQVIAKEGEGPVTLNVVRLGGSDGQATALIRLVSPVNEVEHYYAADCDDYMVLEPAGVPQGNGKEEVEFLVTFEDGETLKSIVFEAIDDDIHESVEFLLIIIAEVTGAEWNESMNRSVLMIEDNEEVIPSTAYFPESYIIADRNTGSAKVKICRTDDGLQYPFSVNYTTSETSNGAAAGTDYIFTDEIAYFEPGVTEVEVEIPLVQNYIYQEEADSVIWLGLYGAAGGDIDENRQVMGIGLINLYDENEAENTDFVSVNLATLLAGQSFAESSSNDTPVMGNAGQELTVEPEQETENEEEPLTLMMNSPAVGLRLLAASSDKYITFTNSSSDNWKPHFALFSKDDGSGTRTINGMDFNYTVADISKDEITKKFSEGDAIHYLTHDNGGNQLRLEGKGIDDPSGYAYFKLLTSKGALSTYGLKGLYDSVYYNATMEFSDKKSYGAIGLSGGSSSPAYYSIINNKGERAKERNIYTGSKSLVDFANGSTGGDYIALGLYDVAATNGSKYTIELNDLIFQRAYFKNPISYRIEGDTENEALINNTLKFSVTGGGLADSTSQRPYMGSTITASLENKAGNYYIESLKMIDKTTGKTIFTGDQSLNISHIVWNGVGQMDHNFEIVVTVKRNINLTIIASDNLAAADAHPLDCYIRFFSFSLMSTAPIITGFKMERTVGTETKTLEVMYENGKQNSLSNLMGYFGASGNDPKAILLYDKYYGALGGLPTKVTFYFNNTDAVMQKHFIVYNGGVYGSGEPISLNTNDMLEKELVFQMTRADLLDKANAVRIYNYGMSKLYLDINDNGIIDDGTDILIGAVTADRYTEEMFAPMKASDGKYHQIIIRAAYNMQPAYYTFSGYTPYRYTQSTEFKDINNGKEYQAYLKANAPTKRTARSIGETKQVKIMPEFNGDSVPTTGYVDIPLGGSFTGLGDWETVGNKSEFKWSPTWKGNLNVPSGTVLESSVTMKHSILGNKFVVASGVEQVKAYYGSFLPNDMITIRFFNENSTQVSTPSYKMSNYQRYIISPLEGMGSLSTELNGVYPNNMNSLQSSVEPSISLSSIDFAIGDTFGIEASGREVLIYLGIPIIACEKKNETGRNDKGEITASTEKDEEYKKSYYSAVKDLIENIDKLGSFFNALSQKNNPFSTVEAARSMGIEISVATSINLVMVYNEDKGEWEFENGVFILSFSGQVNASVQAPAPANCLYGFMVISGGYDMSVGIGMHEVEAADGTIVRKPYFQGVSMSPSLYAEFGGGLGLDGIANIELYFKMNVGFTATLANMEGYAEKKDVSNSFDSMDFYGGIAMRFELLIFNYELDLIGFHIEYSKDGFNKETQKWRYSRVIFNKETEVLQKQSARMFSAFSVAPVSETTEIVTKDELDRTISLPRNRGDEQQVGGAGFTSPYFRTMARLFSSASSDFDKADNVEAATLAENLSASNTQTVMYKGELYMFYTLDDSSRSTYDKSMLVYSKINNNGQLVSPSGGLDAYDIVSDDGTGDSDFFVAADDTEIHVVWVNQKDILADTVIDFDILSTKEKLKLIAANSVICYATIDEIGVKSDSVISSDDGVFRYQPKIAVSGGKTLITYLEAIPYTDDELSIYISGKQEQLLNNAGLLGVTDPTDDELQTISMILVETDYLEHQALIYGKATDLLALEPGKTAVRQKLLSLNDGKRIAGGKIQSAALSMDESGNFTFPYIVEIETVNSGEIITLKEINIEHGSISGGVSFDVPVTALQVTDYADTKASQTKDGYYENGEFHSFQNPFFAELGFAKGNLTGNTPETFLTFNRNGIYYAISSTELVELKSQNNFKIKQLFVVPDGEVSDGRSGLSLGMADDTGTLAAIYIASTAYTGSTALMISTYDPDSNQWSDGRPLVMRKLQTYNDLLSGVITEEEAKADYDADDVQLTFMRPKLVQVDGDEFYIITEASKTQMEEAIIDTDTGTTKMMPKVGSNGIMEESDKAIYIIKYTNPTDGEASGFQMLFNTDLLLPEFSAVPSIMFQNVGGKSLQDVKVALKLHNGVNSTDSKVQEWTIKGSVPAGRRVNVQQLLVVQGDQPKSITLPEYDIMTNPYSYYYIEVTSDTDTWSSDPFPFDTSSAELMIYGDHHSLATMATQGSFVDLDLSFTLENSGFKKAENISVDVYYEQEENGVKTRTLAGDEFIVLKETVKKSLESNEKQKIIFDNNDMVEILTGGIVTGHKPNTANDLSIPISALKNSKGVFTDTKLVIEVSTTTPEINSTYTNCLEIALKPTGSIIGPSSFEVTRGATKSTDPIFAYFAGELTDRVTAEEIPLAGNAPMLTSIKWITYGNDRQLSIQGGYPGETDGKTYIRVYLTDYPSVFMDIPVTVKASGVQPSSTVNIGFNTPTYNLRADGTTESVTVKVDFSTSGTLSYFSGNGETIYTGVENSRSKTYTFTTNGTYLFEVMNTAGKTTSEKLIITEIENPKSSTVSINTGDVITPGKAQVTNLNFNGFSTVPKGSLQEITMGFDYSFEIPASSSVEIYRGGTYITTLSYSAKTNTVSYKITENGDYEVKILCSSEKIAIQPVLSFSVNSIDRTAPTAVISKGSSGANSIAVTAADNSALKSIVVYNSSNTEIKRFTPDISAGAVKEYSGELTVSESGNYYVSAIDYAGNESSRSGITVTAFGSISASVENTGGKDATFNLYTKSGKLVESKSSDSTVTFSDILYDEYTLIVVMPDGYSVYEGKTVNEITHNSPTTTVKKVTASATTGYSISGTVKLRNTSTGSVDSSSKSYTGGGYATLVKLEGGNETDVQTALIASSGTFIFNSVPNGEYAIWINSSENYANASSEANITVTNSNVTEVLIPLTANRISFSFLSGDFGQRQALKIDIKRPDGYVYTSTSDLNVWESFDYGFSQNNIPLGEYTVSVTPTDFKGLYANEFPMTETFTLTKEENNYQFSFTPIRNDYMRGFPIDLRARYEDDPTGLEPFGDFGNVWLYTSDNDFVAAASGGMYTLGFYSLPLGDYIIRFEGSQYCYPVNDIAVTIKKNDIGDFIVVYKDTDILFNKPIYFTLFRAASPAPVIDVTAIGLGDDGDKAAFALFDSNDELVTEFLLENTSYHSLNGLNGSYTLKVAVPDEYIPIDDRVINASLGDAPFDVDYKFVKNLTITGLTAQNDTYDKTAKAGYTGTANFIGGTPTGNLLAYYTGINGTVYSSANAPINAGDYNVKLTLDDDGFIASWNGDFTIEKKAITINPDASQSKKYNAAEPIISYTPSPSLFAGDSFTGMLSRISGEAVGSYKIGIGTLSAGDNYILSFTDNVDFLITKASSPIGADQTVNAAINYENDYAFDLTTLLPGIDGLTNVLYTPVITSDTDNILDAFSYTTGTILTLPVKNIAEEGKSATITVTIASDNYEDFTATITVITVIKIPVTITGITMQGKVYDGEICGYMGEAVITNSITGVKLNDLELDMLYESTDNMGYSSATPPKNKGSYKLRIKTLDSSDYVGSANYVFSITEREISISVGSYRIDKPYDGTTTTGTVTGNLHISGIISSDSGVSVIASPGVYASPNPGSSSILVALAISGDTFGNYKLNAETILVPATITGVVPPTPTDNTNSGTDNENYDNDGVNDDTPNENDDVIDKTADENDGNSDGENSSDNQMSDDAVTDTGDEDKSNSTDEPISSDGNPKTGIAIMFNGLFVSAGVMAISKKRKRK